MFRRYCPLTSHKAFGDLSGRAKESPVPHTGELPPERPPHHAVKPRLGALPEVAGTSPDVLNFTFSFITVDA